MVHRTRALVTALSILVCGGTNAQSIVRLGGEFKVNTFTPGVQKSASVALDAQGDFVVTWMSYAEDGAHYGAFAQRYASAGTSLGVNFQVNVRTLGVQAFPDVAAEPDGDFVVVWLGVDGTSNYGVFARRFNSAGAATGGEFQLNTYTPNTQGGAKIAMDGNGDFVIAWQSQGQDGPNLASSLAPSHPMGRRPEASSRSTLWWRATNKSPIWTPPPAAGSSSPGRATRTTAAAMASRPSASPR